MSNESIKDLEVGWNNELHVYQFKELLNNAVDNFIKENTSIENSILDVKNGTFKTTYTPVKKIDSDELYKIMWKKRTILNNRAKDIAKKRKQAVAIMVNGFVSQCKEIETKIIDASENITKMLNEYKPREQSKPTTIYKLVIKTDSLEVKKKLENIALDNGAEVSE